MAKTNNTDYTQKHGKLNKKDNVIHRVRNGKEHIYSIIDPYNGPASKAQKDHRKLFGKVNSIVNIIMADPKQQADWTARKDAFNHQMVAIANPKRFKTTRQYVFALVSERLKRKTLASSAKTDSALLPKGVQLQIVPFPELDPADLYEILKARYAVFTMEQGIRYLDEDNIDYIATHIFFRFNGRVIAYARLFPEVETGVMRVGRMLTTERGKGYGKYLMEQIVEETRNQGFQKLRLHAQIQAAEFYRKLGFKTIGETFMEAEIPHVIMERNI